VGLNTTKTGNSAVFCRPGWWNVINSRTRKAW
jgi:hypothetical protein